MLNLTARQRQLLRILKSSEVCPSFEEMKDALGLKSKHGVHRLISALTERGYIRRVKYHARSIEILDRATPAYEPPKQRTLGSYTVSQLIAELEARGITFPARTSSLAPEALASVASPVAEVSAPVPSHREAQPC